MSRRFHNAELERVCKARIHRRLKQMPQGLKDARNHQRNLLWRRVKSGLGSLVLLSATCSLVRFIEHTAALTSSGRLGALSLLMLWLVTLLQSHLHHHLVVSADLLAWVLLPISPDRLLEHQISKGLNGSVMMRITILTVSLTLGLSWRPDLVGGLSGVILASLLWVTLRSLCALMAVSRVVASIAVLGWISFLACFMLVYVSGLRGLFINGLNAYGNEFSFLLPMGWILRVFRTAQGILPPENLLLLLSTCVLVLMARSMSIRLRDRMDIFQAPLRKLTGEGVIMPMESPRETDIPPIEPSGRARDLYPEIAASIRSRTFLVADWTPGSLGFLDRVWWRWLTPRQQLLVSCFLTTQPHFASQLQSAVKYLGVGFVAGWITFTRDQGLAPWVWGLAAVCVAFKSAPAFLSSFVAVYPSAGEFTSGLVLHPIALGEVQAMALKTSVLLTAALCPALVLYGVGVSFVLPAGWTLMLLLGVLKVSVMLPLLHQLLLLSSVSGTTSDTSRITIRSFVLFCVCLIGLLFGLGFAGACLFGSGLGSWCALIPVWLCWGALVWVYRKAFDDRVFDCFRKSAAPPR